ncbi:MAG: hypothetical protein ACLFQ1_09920 [Halochromatium sp.]
MNTTDFWNIRATRPQLAEEVDLRDHLIRPDESLDLYLLPAGVTNADYARLLRFTDPLSWYREEANPLRKMVAQLRQLSFQPDLILFDARTGFNALNAPFLFEFSDLAVIVFFPHPQARQGTGELVRGLLTSTTLRHQDQDGLTLRYPHIKIIFYSILRRDSTGKMSMHGV